MAQAHKFRKAKSLFSTTLSAGISTGTSETITLNSVSGLPTDTEITITIDRVDASGTATPTKVERITGIISGSNLTSFTRGIDGTTEQAHSSGAVVEYIWNADDLNDLVDGVLVQHNQAGGHTTLTASSITAASTVTSSSIVSSAITASSIVVSTTVALPNATTSTGDGQIVYDRTNEKLLIGDGTNTQAVQTGAWTTWNPTITSSTNTITTKSATGEYCVVGKSVFVQLTITITTNGTGAGAVQSTLPVNADAGQYVLAGRENAVGGKGLHAIIDAVNGMKIYNYDNSYPGGDGYTLFISGVYQSA